MKYLIVIFICAIVHISHSQSLEQGTAHESNQHLIKGTWYFDYTSDDFSQELTFNNNGNFTMTSIIRDEDAIKQEGAYTVKDDMLTLNFTDGAVQVNEITLLNGKELKFVYIETIYKYTRVKKDY